MNQPVALALSFLLACPLILHAHGGLHEQLAELNQRLQHQTTSNATLYLQRAVLHRLHRDPDSALADCARAEQLDPALAAVHLVRGQILADMDKLEPARDVFDRFLIASPQHTEGLLARARVQARLKDFNKADADFAAAIRNAPAPQPDYFVERTEALVAAGKISEAVKVLDDAIRTLGPLAVLQTRAIDLQLQTGSFEDALSRVDQLRSQSPRQERWLALRGKVLQRAGRRDEAQASFTAALTAIESLPAGRRGTEQTKVLESAIRSALRELASAPRPPG